MIRLRKSAVIGGGRNRSAPGCRRIESGVRHPQRPENFALAETVKAFIGDTLQRDRQNDKSDVAVFGGRARIGRQRSGESRRQQFIPGLVFKKELFIRGQTGGVRQQHAHRYLAPPAYQLPANSGTMLATGASRSMSPRSYRIIAMVVVATTFETEARSKTVATVTGRRAGFVSESPKGFQRNQIFPDKVTATEAAGNAARQ